MKIIHLCLSCFYIDGYAYQENQLVAAHVSAGHDVTVIASTESFDLAKLPCYLTPGEYIGTDGAKVIRLPYRFSALGRLGPKIRAYPGVNALLEKLAPDMILFHGLCAWELITVARFGMLHPLVRIYADCHEDFNNSARTLLSRWGLHFLFYRPILRYCLSQLQRILCVSQESINFAHRMYGVPLHLLELYPLGGQVYEDAEYLRMRASQRNVQGWHEETRVFIQTGKIDNAKRLVDSLRAFVRLTDKNLRFAIVGKLMPDISEQIRPLIDSDERIQNLGWASPELLRALLCAADIYVQPGSQSATMQMSLCCRCVVVLDDVLSHHVYVDNNGFLVRDATQLSHALERLAKAPRQQINVMSAYSANLAARLLDYRQLAQRVLR